MKFLSVTAWLPYMLYDPSALGVAMGPVFSTMKVIVDKTQI